MKLSAYSKVGCFRRCYLRSRCRRRKSSSHWCTDGRCWDNSDYRSHTDGFLQPVNNTTECPHSRSHRRPFQHFSWPRIFDRLLII